MPVALCCESIHKAFGQPVLRGVSVEVARGECVALLGPSGCGKSTLLNVVAGLLGADAGVLGFEGQVLDDPAAGVRVPIRNRRFSIVFQDFSLWPHLSVAENVAFGLRMAGVSSGERERQVRESLRRVRMEGFLERMPAALSGGQQQRVAIARAIAVEPRLLLLDEPLSALDATLREELREELAGLVRDLSMTTILVTHDQSEALSIADRVAVMHAGRIEQVDAPQTLYHAPESAFTASFVGSASLLAVEAVEMGVRMPCGATIGRAALDGEPRAGIAVLRRECLVADPSPPGPSETTIAGRVRRHLFMGDRHEVRVETGGGSELRAIASAALAIDTPVWIRVRPGSVRILPPQRGDAG